MKIFLLLMALLSSPSLLMAKAFPSHLLQLDDHFTHHVLIVEKATHQLHLYKNDNGIPQHIQSIKIATGKKLGNKIYQGDHRTPEGIYYLTEFLAHQDLIGRFGKEGEKYGVGAFVLNYPNPVDAYDKKTGNGIWIHSTDDEERIEKGLDSRGCVVMTNKELIDLSRYIELNKTSIVIVHNLTFLSENTWKLERQHLLATIEGWLNAWKNENIKDYISYYHPYHFRDPIRGNFNQFKEYKKSVFSHPGKPEIHIGHVSIMKTQNYAVISFKQFYKSRSINDTGKKLLYLKKDDYYNWKIVSEIWTKVGIDKIAEGQAQVAFDPSQRFFDTEDPSQILNIKYAKKNK